MRAHCRVVAPVLAVLCSGCTAISVRPTTVEPKAQGLRYSLPKTILMVKPLRGGKMDVHFEFLPDPAQTYAIDADSFLAKQTLETEFYAKGFLKKVDWNADSTAVAVKGIGVLGEVAKTALDQENAKRNAALDDAKTDLETARKDRRTALDDVAKLEGELRVLQQELANIQPVNKPNEPEIRRLELAIAQKRDQLNDASQAVPLDQATVSKLKTELNALERERATLPNIVDPKTGDIATKKIEIQKKEEQLALARAHLRRLDRQLVNINYRLDDLGFDPATGSVMRAAGGSSPKVHGGLLFAVEEGVPVSPSGESEGRTTVVLRAVPTEGAKELQVTFESGSPPTAAPRAPAEPKLSASVMGGGIEVLRPESRANVIERADKVRVAELMLQLAKNRKVPVQAEIDVAADKLAVATQERDNEIQKERLQPPTLRIQTTLPFKELDPDPSKTTLVVKGQGPDVLYQLLDGVVPLGDKDLLITLPSDIVAGRGKLTIQLRMPSAGDPDKFEKGPPVVVEILIR